MSNVNMTMTRDVTLTELHIASLSHCLFVLLFNVKTQKALPFINIF